MATTSTVPAFRAALVAGLRARPGLSTIQIERRWPGPATEAEGIWLGDVQLDSAIASIKTGRQRRQETYRLQVVIQTMRAAETPADADVSEDRAFELLAELEGWLAENPKPITGTAQVAQYVGAEEVTVPFESSWATRITAVVEVTDRLI